MKRDITMEGVTLKQHIWIWCNLLCFVQDGLLFYTQVHQFVCFKDGLSRVKQDNEWIILVKDTANSNDEFSPTLGECGGEYLESKNAQINLQIFNMQTS